MPDIVQEAPDVTGAAKKFIFGEKTYNFLKFMALVFLPALGTFYFTMGTVWMWPNIEQVVGSITAVDTFLGVILGISTRQYNASDAKYGGAINVITKDDGTTLYSLDLNSAVEELGNMQDITFKVNQPS